MYNRIPLVTLFFSLLFIFIQLFTASNYPIFRDELYYIDCTNHPAFGYVDHPPLSIWILTIWKFVFGDSQISLRVIPALCGAVLIMLTAIMSKEFGGNKLSQIFASVTVFSGLYFLAVGGFYSMNAFDSVFWAVLFLMLIKIVKSSTKFPSNQGGDNRYRPSATLRAWWIYFGIIAGLGLMNKISVGYLGLGILVSILLTHNRVWLKQKNIWLGGLAALVIFSPYVIWNIVNDYATAEFIQNAQRYKIAEISPLDFLKEQILLVNPLSAPVWIAGLIALLFGLPLAKGEYHEVTRESNLKSFRIIGLTYVVILVLLIIMRSKPYYLAAVYPVLIAAGANAVAGVFHQRLKYTVVIAYSVLLITSTALFSPMVIPVLAPHDAAAHIKSLGIMPSSGERNRQSELPQILADRFGWEELTEKVAKVYNSLPDAEKKFTSIYAENYGEAGAINYYGRKYNNNVSPLWGENRGGFPHCFSGHNNHYLWGPPVNDLAEDDSISTLIIIGGDIEDQRSFFNEVNVMDTTYHPYAMPFENGVPIYLCRGFKKPLKEIWKSVKFYI